MMNSGFDGVNAVAGLHPLDQRRFAGAYGAADSDSASCIVAHNFIFLFLHSFIPGAAQIRLRTTRPAVALK